MKTGFDSSFVGGGYALLMGPNKGETAVQCRHGFSMAV